MQLWIYLVEVLTLRTIYGTIAKMYEGINMYKCK